MSVKNRELRFKKKKLVVWFNESQFQLWYTDVLGSELGGNNKEAGIHPALHHLLRLVVV